MCRIQIGKMALHIHKFLPNYKLKIRLFSTQLTPKNTVKYTNTINLPKTKYPARLAPQKRSEIERNLVQTSFADLYQYQREHNLEPEFVLHDGPPYANGDLHMGHAVNKILKDITIRQHVVNGRKIDYKPGWDCHGLPIELKAMSGQNNLDSLTIRRKSRQYATDASEAQRTEFQSWGIMADWSNPGNLYKTFRSDYVQHEFQIFLNLYKKGLVYRDLKPVFWSPSSRTALAEAELEYDPNFISPSIILRLKLSRTPLILENLTIATQNIYALIWTTTPWTLPSNQAICFNPLLEYSVIKFNNDESNLYLIASTLLEEFLNNINQTAQTITTITGEHLEGSTYFHPIDMNCELPFFPSQHVQDDKGTGLVHTAPAHGSDDFLIGLRHNIPIKCFINEEGMYDDSAPDFLVSKCALSEGNGLVTKYLQDDLLHVGRITHSYPIDWRTKKPVIVRASDQWFINTEQLKGRAIEEIEKVNFYPRLNSDISKRTLIAQIEKRPYWCVSRQRAWGVPIPVFYEKTTKQPIINEFTIQAIVDLLNENGNMDFWWSDSLIKQIPQNIWDKCNVDASNIEPGRDIFDIWFDSGVSWSYALAGNKIADLYLEGFDQFTGWFQSSLLMSVAHRDHTPYRSIFVHGFTVDEKGHKMSKSLGNVILPKDIIGKCGIDALRWWVASHGTQHSSIIVSEHLLQSCTETLNKIRLSLKYLNGSIGQRENCSEQVNGLTYLDRYMRNELWNFDKEVHIFYNHYEYNRVTAHIQHFIANQISSVYLNLIKDRLYCGNSSQITTLQTILQDCYKILSKALWPIVPFIVEESWSYYNPANFYKTRIQSVEEWKDPFAENVINTALDLKQIFNQNARDVNTWTLDVHVKCGSDKFEVLKSLHPKLDKKLTSTELCELLQVSSLKLSIADGNEYQVIYNVIEQSLCPRCRRFSVQVNESVCERCNLVLQEN